mmetsp:Transcript_69755/g.131495  ORF Transcript_69755/g.131495 Transcript_69755/m.131495 type:complete len:126 (-) Transcript_69755:522-899(-)
MKLPVALTVGGATKLLGATIAPGAIKFPDAAENVRLTGLVALDDAAEDVWTGEVARDLIGTELERDTAGLEFCVLREAQLWLGELVGAVVVRPEEPVISNASIAESGAASNFFVPTIAGMVTDRA